jgi:hypothetical protein
MLGAREKPAVEKFRFGRYRDPSMPLSEDRP